ncbi:hypothetical protein [Streptomyces graminilatus]|uniref:hypothetical protein n=1 Tax=Streptomyces graminilatus TaxID=1464070 RepID=UPI000B152356|nr:hypothetical protein [Streptomyces graminilatus]
MAVHPLADQAALLRAKSLAFLRAPVSREMWKTIMDGGHSFVMPAAWQALPRARQIESVIAAEDKRIADGTTFAMADELRQAANAVGQDQSIPLPFTEDVLPAPSGMLVFSAQEPLLHVNSHPLIAVTWGPPMEGFSPQGVHLTWWTAMRDEHQKPDAAARGQLIPMMPDFDLHLPFLPQFDTRLHYSNAELSSTSLYSAVPLRTVVAAWYVLTATSTTLSEQRPRATVTQTLKELKAKRRGVQVATGAADTARRDITDRAADKMRQLVEPNNLLKPAPEIAATSRTVSYGVFEPGRDHQLDSAHRRIARIYREAAAHWHRLEMQAIQRYPGVFTFLEDVRAREHELWQPWCWMPSLRVAAWLMKMYNAPTDKAMWDSPRIAALGAWRSGGRHSVQSTLPIGSTASDRVPVGLLNAMPAPGLGMVIDAGGTVDLLLACLDDVSARGDRSPSDAELLLISNYGEPDRLLEDVTKLTVYLTGNDLLDAVKITQAYYDAAAVQNGKEPQTADDTAAAEHAQTLGQFTGLLAAICAPDTALQDAGALTGRKLPAPWPPQPNVLSETTLWLLTDIPTAH